MLQKALSCQQVGRVIGLLSLVMITPGRREVQTMLTIDAARI